MLTVDTHGIIKGQNECSRGAGNTRERGQSGLEIDMDSLSSASPTVKFCHDCGETKPLSDFRTRNDIRSGVNSYCKLCERVRRDALSLALESKPITDREIQKFWAKAKKTDGCWEWQGRKNNDGYGHFSYRYKTLIASRFSYMLTNGAIPDGLGVLHKCDNPACVRPDHLFLGTQKDNIQDMVQKRRHWVWTRPDLLAVRRFPLTNQKGEANGNARLSWSIVRTIRARFAAGNVTKASLAREFQVGETTISDIVRNRKWRE